MQIKLLKVAKYYPFLCYHSDSRVFNFGSDERVQLAEITAQPTETVHQKLRFICQGQVD